MFLSPARLSFKRNTADGFDLACSKDSITGYSRSEGGKGGSPGLAPVGNTRMMMRRINLMIQQAR
jgi:hypothetical protein